MRRRGSSLERGSIASDQQKKSKVSEDLSNVTYLHAIKIDDKMLGAPGGLLIADC